MPVGDRQGFTGTKVPGSDAMVLFSLIWTPVDISWQILSFLAPTVLAIILLGYFVPHTITCLFFRQKNLKKAYNAEWALVTGASSGAYREDFGRERM